MTSTSPRSARRLSAAARCVVVCAIAAASSACDADAPPSNSGAADTRDVASDGGDVDGSTAAVRAGCKDPGTPGATATCLEPTMAPEYYVDEALKYFDELDLDADRARIPAYSDLVARWEWPPWLLLTGYTREEMISTAESLRVGDPSRVPVRDCRFFDTQPFARCYVTFEYERGGCPIYEEFTFNDAGETTFIEAWSNLPGMMPMPDPAADPWGEGPAMERLSTRVPGLGNATGLIDPQGEWMTNAAESDPELADFALRTEDMWKHWFQALSDAPDDFFGLGCGW